MFCRAHAVLIALVMFVANTFVAAPAQAARPIPKRRSYAAYNLQGKPIRYGYGFAPYLYYEIHGFRGIQGAPNANPLRYGYGDSIYGSSEFLFGQSDFGN